LAKVSSKICEVVVTYYFTSVHSRRQMPLTNQRSLYHSSRITLLLLFFNFNS